MQLSLFYYLTQVIMLDSIIWITSMPVDDFLNINDKCN